MSRWSAYGQKDTQVQTDGDMAFRGVDMIHDRALLPQGYLARSENKRLREGPAATRAGIGFPGDFNPTFANKFIGSHIYSNPNGEEVMLVAESNATYVWALQFNKDPIKINLGAGANNGTGFVHFAQAFEKVELFRFPLQTPLVWDGNNAHTFDAVTLSVTGRTLIPSVINAVPHQNRLLLYNPYYPTVPWRNQILMTDILDYTSYDPDLSLFRINAGESDMITSVFPYFKGSVVVYMRDSVHMLEDFTIYPANATQRLLNNRIGSVGYLGPLQVGSDVIALGRGFGYYRLSEIIQDQIAAQPVPLSRPIQPFIDTIDWDRANLYHCSAALDDYAFFAVPTKGKTGASEAILVFNTVTSEWESVPDWVDDANFRINRLHVTLFNGAPRVFALDYAASRIYVLYDGLEDQVNDDSLPVQDVIETRGYVCGDPSSFKRFQRASVGVRTYNPGATVTAISDGVSEEKEIATIDKSRLKFYTHGHEDFDPGVSDPNEPKREDYSVQNLDNIAIEDFEDLPLGVIAALPPTLDPIVGPKQQSMERMVVRQNGRWCSLRISNTNGQCDVLGVAIDAIPAQEGVKVVA